MATAWTPDSTGVIFHTARNGTSDIFTQRFDSAVAEPLVIAPGDQADPRSTGDGHWVLYKDFGRSPFRIMRVRLSGGTPEQVFAGPEGAFIAQRAVDAC